MPPRRVLIIGGTGEARRLADTLSQAGFAAVTSLAGVTSSPLMPTGEVRQGGFGGVEGLVAYLRTGNIAAVIDASHPFAVRISQHAHQAAAAAGLPYLRLERLAWEPQAGDRWIEAGSIAEAAAALPSGARALVTIGRKDIAAFFERPDIGGVARMIEAPLANVPDGWEIVRARPPFTLQSEMGLLRWHVISHVVSKNAGGEDTYAKIAAARETKIPVVMLKRPAKPAAVMLVSPELLLGELRKLLST